MKALELERVNITGNDRDIDHIYCPCDPNLGLCGTDITDYEEEESFDHLCVVCDDLEYSVCKKCGG